MAPPLDMKLPRLARLRAFDSVGVAGAMSGAAFRLHMTQPAITRAVRALERELRTRLFERTPGGSFLTEEGRIFARRVRRFLRQMDEAVAATLGSDVAGSGVTRLTRKIGDSHVRSLLAIAGAGNFRRAARALGIAEPTLHRAARDIERLIGTPLYRAMPGGIGLTPAGAELARRLALATVEIKAGTEELALHRGAGATSMTIGMLALAPKRLLATITNKVLAAHPNAQVTLREGSYDELIEAMRSGAVDLVFGALRSPPPFGDLSEDALFEDPYCVVCRRGHPLARLRRPTRADLRRYDWIFPTSTLPRRAVLDEFITAWRLSSRVQVETNSPGAVIASLAVSDRLSLLPHGYVAGDDQQAGLTVLDVRVRHPRRMVGLTSRRDWLPTAFHADIVSMLRAASSRRGTVRRSAGKNRRGQVKAPKSKRPGQARPSWQPKS